MAAIAPDLNIPPSTAIVDVSIIDTTSTLRGIPTLMFFAPQIPGHEILAAPVYSFLIQHPKLQRTLVFDLGIRKDWVNYAPALVSRFKGGNVQVLVEKSVREILDEGGVNTKDIEAVIWSHHHLDHIGNPAEFEPSTALIVGPGFKENLTPGYPTKEDSILLDSDWAGRELVELEFSSGLKIGKMEAIDYFGDGSFYFLNSPGHAIGHVCGLARVTVEPPSFVMLGGDAYHHGGEIRPSPFLPLPSDISPHPFTTSTLSSCPGSLFEPLLRDGDRTKTFADPSPAAGAHFDVSEAIRSIKKLQEADVRNDILMTTAHDETLLDIVDFFPNKLNDFMQRGWVQKARWKFLMDYAKAVGYDGKVDGKRDWRPAEFT